MSDARRSVRAHTRSTRWFAKWRRSSTPRADACAAFAANRRDLLEAVHWIAKDNPAAARGLSETIARAARRLDNFPKVDTARPELADEPARFLPLTGYPCLLVYDAAEIPPLILRVLHGARDLPALFGKKETGE